MWTASFWKQTVERAVKTFVQAMIAVIGVNHSTLTSVPWLDVLNVAGLAALVSVLMSVVSALRDTDEGLTPSLVSVTPKSDAD